MTDKSASPDLRASMVIVGVVLALTALAMLFPGGLLWAFSLPAFLPPTFFAAFAVAVLLLLIAVRGNGILRFTERFAGAVDRRPVLAAVVLALGFIAAALAFHIRASILGDSYNLLQNFSDYSRGVSILAPWHEPLSIYTLYYAIRMLGSVQIPHVYWAFAVVEIVFGVATALLLRSSVRALFSSPVDRLLALLLALVLPTTAYFFGYIEVYAVSTFLIALFLLCGLLVLRGSLPYAILPPLAVLVVISHYINGLFGLALLYVTCREYKARGFRPVLAGVGAGVIAAFAILALARFDIMRLIDESPISHFLSPTTDISPINAYSQAYTLLSPYHAIDLANYLLFMTPVPVLLVAWWSLRGTLRLRDGEDDVRFLLLSWAPFLLFMLVAKLEQGFASDWDVFAGHFLPFALWFALYTRRYRPTVDLRTFILIVAATALFALPWYILNATRDPSIRRFTSLWDDRILSHLGRYTHTLRLGKFYEAEGDSTATIGLWERYMRDYPTDPRGYENRIAAIAAHAPDSLAARDSTYGRWLAVDPRNAALRASYAQFLTGLGNDLLGRENLATARLLYEKAIFVDSSATRAMNNLGTLLARSDSLPAATLLFERAVRYDSSYADAYYNLGNAYIDGGRPEEGRRLIERAAALGNSDAIEYRRTHAPPQR